uniref:Uncharacterized protein n=1 Tax=Cannabis sativa TaxID=3483 RepID=A0A803PQW7_CANSA
MVVTTRQSKSTDSTNPMVTDPNVQTLGNPRNPTTESMQKITHTYPGFPNAEGKASLPDPEGFNREARSDDIRSGI